jgi:multidrug resistance efflux pump
MSEHHTPRQLAAAPSPAVRHDTKTEDVEAALWAAFASARGLREIFPAWLELQCRMIAGARGGVLLFEPEGGQSLAPAAIWPDRARDMSHLREAAEKALGERRGVVLRQPADGAQPAVAAQIAYPIDIDGRIYGVALLDLNPDADTRLALRRLHWGIGWLIAYLWKRRAAEGVGTLERSAAALDILAAAQEQDKFEAAAMAVVNETAIRLNCDRVSVGIVMGAKKARTGRIAVKAMSHAAWFKRRSELVDALENAMEEALDQIATVSFPRAANGHGSIAVAHADYARVAKAEHVISIVLVSRGRPIGVMTLERRNETGFDPETVLIAETTAALVAPALDLKFEARRWVAGRIVDFLHDTLKLVFGPDKPSYKAAAVAAAVLLAILIFYPADFRVAADATLEGGRQRAAVAPFAGFIKDAPIRAGALVKEGDILAVLDDRDYRLDLLRWTSERQRLEQQQRQALAERKRTDAAVLQARLDQTQAQIDLAAAKLGRTEIRAPITGQVISGDHSQKLGSPVEQGALLYEIAPLDSYRVALRVPERDVQLVKVGQKGRLLLTGSNEAELDFTVTNVTAVAEAKDGVNTFRVEAALGPTSADLRPGMEGIAKVVIGERSLLWTWVRPVIEWARVFVWRWTP